MTVLIDDQIVGRLLRDEWPAELPPTVKIYATAYWLGRLYHAVLAASEADVILSAQSPLLADALGQEGRGCTVVGASG